MEQMKYSVRYGIYIIDPCKFNEFLVDEKNCNHPNGMVVLLKIMPLEYTLIVN